MNQTVGRCGVMATVQEAGAMGERAGETVSGPGEVGPK